MPIRQATNSELIQYLFLEEQRAGVEELRVGIRRTEGRD
jgi:hypothetical protein